MSFIILNELFITKRKITMLLSASGNARRRGAIIRRTNSGFKIKYNSKGLTNAETGKLQGGGKFLTHNQVYRQIRLAEGLNPG